MKMDRDVLLKLLMMHNPQMAPFLELLNDQASETSQPKKRKVSAYSRRYGAAYKRLRRKHTLKSGKMRKGINHKKLDKMAHKEAKRSKR